MKDKLFQYLLLQADNVLILGQRLGEWCGHGPALEVDMALTNISLDLLGQARMYFQYAAEVQGEGKSEDDLAFLRHAGEYRNVLLLEQPNTDFAYTILRQFFFDTYHELFLEKLKDSKDSQLAAIAEKSLKEVKYHVRYSREWIFRLGDGTEESHEKMQKAVDDLWMYHGELCHMTELEKEMAASGIGVDLSEIKGLFDKEIKTTLEEATLTVPESGWMQKGGKIGRHTEHLGYILSDMQFLQRAYPGAEW